MSKKVLYLECFSGISGDMTVGALLDLGADPEVLKQSLDLLHVEGYEIKIGRSSKCGIDACDFDVLIPDQPEYDEGHMHHHHDEDHDHAHEHHHHDEDHDNAHEHHHHDHDHAHHHAHVHRNIHDVFAVIDKLEKEHVKELAKKMFMTVGEAESKAHGCQLKKYIFRSRGH